jgi:hypothetical protein
MKLLLPLLLLPLLSLPTLADGEEPDFQALIAKLSVKEPLEKRRDARAELWVLGEAAWPILRQAVAENSDDGVAGAAAFLLAVQQDRESLPAIIARLRRTPAAAAPDYAQAAVALAAVEGPRALGPLHDAALGEAGDFRYALARALLSLPPEDYAKISGRGAAARADLAAGPARQAVVPLVPTSFESKAGATGTIAPDGTVTVTGTLGKDTYTLKATAPAGGNIVGFILETLPDPSLPAQGPGRADDGNFSLSRFAAWFGYADRSKEATDGVMFACVTATHETKSGSARMAIDDIYMTGEIGDNLDTGWEIAGGVGKPQSATFELFAGESQTIRGAISEKSPLKILLDHQHPSGKLAIGKFKISVIQEVSK